MYLMAGPESTVILFEVMWKIYVPEGWAWVNRDPVRGDVEALQRFLQRNGLQQAAHPVILDVVLRVLSG